MTRAVPTTASPRDPDAPAGAAPLAVAAIAAGFPAASAAAAAAPPVAALAALARSRGLVLPDGRALTFAPASGGATPALDWERSIAATACVRLREGSWHDAFNALAWLAFPCTKAALNAVHVAARAAGGEAAGTPGSAPRDPAGGPPSRGNARSRARDAATLLDESGVVVACAAGDLVGAWREHRWRDAFGDAARVGASLAAWVVGHGVLDKLRAPFPGLTAKVLVLPVAPAALPREPEARRADLDRRAAAWIVARGAAFAPDDLLPLPLAALPALAWQFPVDLPLSADSRRFDDVAVFRPARGVVTTEA